tara:strand:+ start:531 stop:659 length:129 start_codon:yes stop_codon:yes gene_type:complete
MLYKKMEPLPRQAISSTSKINPISVPQTQLETQTLKNIELEI